MGLKLRITLLTALAAGALLTGVGAYRTLKPVKKDHVPEEIYAKFTAAADKAQFYIKSSGAYVAVYEKERDRSPVEVTSIELDCLRGADRAMIEEGIPVSSRRELLLLLEDLGS